MKRLLDYEWNPKKAASNLRKHRVSFEEGATVFGDPFGLTYDDPDHSQRETRYLTLVHLLRDGCSLLPMRLGVSELG